MNIQKKRIGVFVVSVAVIGTFVAINIPTQAVPIEVGNYNPGKPNDGDDVASVNTPPVVESTPAPTESPTIAENTPTSVPVQENQQKPVESQNTAPSPCTQ